MKPDELKAPVARLFTLGEPEFDEDWPSFRKLGILPEHIPDLLRVATDEELNAAQEDGEDAWAPLHAWRALGQMRAVEAIAPLLGQLARIDDKDNDWLGEESPTVFSKIGAAVIPALEAYVQDAKHPPLARSTAVESLGRLGVDHAPARKECVAALERLLRRFTENDPGLNGYLVAALVELESFESAALIGQAFSAGRVEDSAAGDWEDVQVELGLKLADEEPESDFNEFNLFKTAPKWTPHAGAAAAGDAGAPVYRLQLTLERIEPPVRRTLLVRGDIKLSLLHEVFVRAMGWSGDHLHQFEVMVLGERGRLTAAEVEKADEVRTRLSEVAARVGDELTYEYDLGDSWCHRVRVEAIGPEAGDYPGYPVCPAGERACPPEDSGGVVRYQYMLEILRNPRHKEYAEVARKLGANFKPNAFDLAAANRRLEALR